MSKIKIALLVILGLVVVTLGPILILKWSVLFNRATIKERVELTYMQPQKVIENYEYFYSSYNDVMSTISKYNYNNKQLKTNMGMDGDATNKLITETRGLYSYLMTIVSDYNAKSKMYTRDKFKAVDLPHDLKIINVGDGIGLGE